MQELREHFLRASVGPRDMERCARWIADASTADERNGHSPESLAFLLWGITNTFQMRAMLTAEEATPLSVQVTRILDVFFHGALYHAPPRRTVAPKRRRKP